MTTYELVKELLINEPNTRNSDKLLHVRVWQKLDICNDMLNLDIYMKPSTPSTETIRRSRQAIQRAFPELMPTDKKVAIARGFKQEHWYSIFYETTGQGRFV